MCECRRDDDIIQNLKNGFSFNAVLEFLKLTFVVLVFIFMHFLVSWSVIIWAYIKGGLKFILDQPWVIYSISAFLFGLGFLSLFNLGPAGYYFSNISMFVSLPILISIVVFYLPKKWQKFIFPVIFIIVLVQSMNGIRPKTIRYYPSKTADHSLITEILKMRYTLGDNVIMRYPDQFNLRSQLGMKNCLAQPFFFPAISERSWLGAIDEKGCDYKFFNYSNYLNVDLLGKEKRYNKSYIPSNLKIVDFKKQ